ncbi:hypothetical protein LIER_04002 [Lithospermum erythrorhizon]|uniref:Pollen Ole e 1 allergen and extensin family protein n=1 Tax=Lithospermum erythrorhizon TaxID=34254 RepID=A0AAV3NWG7_LITER
MELVFMLTTGHYLPAKSRPQKMYVELVVEGVVFCQCCARRGMWSFTGAKPIENSTVSVICKDHRNKVIFYKPFKTNAVRYFFYAQLKGFKITNPFHDHPLQTCRVKLVSSPVKDGAPLHFQDKRLVGPHYEAIIYGACPLAFRPAKCTPKPQY